MPLTEKGVEVLREAALRGHPQVRGNYHGPDGDCVLGVFHIDMHQANRAEALQCKNTTDCLMDIYNGSSGHITDRITDQTAECCRALINANDMLGWDFLTIATKLGPTSAEA